MIATLSKTKEILSKYDLQAKKKFGQNFLIDSNIVNKIISIANLDKETGVLEIGPGIGSVTEIICSNAKKVLCYEIDNDMVNVLSNEIIGNNLKIINDDFLKCDLNEALEYFNDCKRIIVISNLPYYITTPIIFKLTSYKTKDNNKPFSNMIFMVQKEVATRLTSKPGTKDYGSLSVLIKYKAITKLEMIVSRNCFYPAPNVDSAVISLIENKIDYKINNEDKFLEFIRIIFEMKRKTLVNNISSNYYLDNKEKLSKEKIESIIENLSLAKTIRAESLELEQIITIFNEINKKQ